MVARFGAAKPSGLDKGAVCGDEIQRVPLAVAAAAAAYEPCGKLFPLIPSIWAQSNCHSARRGICLTNRKGIACESPPREAAPFDFASSFPF
jgi:hypothetical protein